MLERFVMSFARLWSAFSIIFVVVFRCGATDLTPLRIEDIYRLDGAQLVIPSPDNKKAAYIRRWIDAETRSERFALGWVDGDRTKLSVLEPGEPDVRSAVFSPDGKWLAVRSIRPRPMGWKQTPAAAPQSDPATDIWLVSVDGRRSIPLSGRDTPYGRVFADTFYGRVSFSPDGKRLAFIADDGRDPRTPEEVAADVTVVRPDQGEGYTGFGTAQLWVAHLDDAPREFAARRIDRLTNDDIWYGDPQWSPDGRWLVCHANKSGDVESVRFSINKDFNLWAIDSATGRQRQLTFGPGPEVSPRIAPDGSKLVCLSSPRKGPHADVLNLVSISLPRDDTTMPISQVLFDHHANESPPPHPIPAFPLPDDCWDGPEAILYNSYAGVANQVVRLELASARGTPITIPNEVTSDAGAAIRRMIAQRKLTPAGNQVLSKRLRAEDRIVQWKNGKLELEGVVTIPPPQVTTAPYPLIVYPHGGPHSRSSPGFNFTVQVFASHGYAVFQPNFRGSAGYGRGFLDADRHDLGGGDMNDILTGIEALVAEGLVDRQRQFIYGISYGGYMTTWLVGHTNQFRAAVSQNAVTDMDFMWGLSDLQSWTRWELGGQPWEVREAMRKHSPWSYIDRVRTPTLILHSRDDRRCPVAMGYLFHQGLLARGVPTQMVVYPNEGHGIRQPRHQEDVLRRTLAWFATYDRETLATVVTLGDSITRGIRSGVTAEQTFAALTESQLRKGAHRTRVINVGRGGERTDQALERLDEVLTTYRPALVTIMYGTNDSYVDAGKSASRLSLDVYQANLAQLVKRIRAAGAVAVLMTEPRWGAAAKSNGLGEHPNHRLEQYVAACRDLARQLEVPLVDHFAHWTERERQGQDLGAWTTDQCHPNPRGHEELANLMLPVVRQQLGMVAEPTGVKP